MPETQKNHRVAVIPGDGIGQEVVPQGIRVLERVAALYGIGFEWEVFDWGCERYVLDGAMMPADGLEILSAHDSIYLGAVGLPGVPDHVSLWGLLIPIRREFKQYINLRPIRTLRGVSSPLRDPAPIDMVVVRENNEGEYSEIGGRLYRGEGAELAVQESVFTRRGVSRAIRFACELAATRRSRIMSATKSNGIIHTMPFWDEIFAETVGCYPGLEAAQQHIDALAATFVLKPQTLDVVVASNLFGDILTDLGAAIVGSIGIAPSANINPERDHPSMFEPIHGSAPDIAGRGIANPIGQIWAGAMMLEHLGHADAAAAVLDAVERVLEARQVRTPDLGGSATGEELTDAIVEAIVPRSAAGAS